MAPRVSARPKYRSASETTVSVSIASARADITGHTAQRPSIFTSSSMLRLNAIRVRTSMSSSRAASTGSDVGGLPEVNSDTISVNCSGDSGSGFPCLIIRRVSLGMVRK